MAPVAARERLLTPRFLLVVASGLSYFMAVGMLTSQLFATGWKPPMQIKMKAADGKTDIYGMLFRPTNFDPSKKYPVVENIYTGPQSAYVPKTFAAYRNQQQAIAELGFIAVFVDGRGTALRSRAFRAFAYHNLGFGPGGDDHITVFKQMAAKYPYMDLTRVGVWGHSAGGYDSTHAILTHPEFYKVAVSSAGCHDNRMDKATWNEQWMGWPVDKHYEEVSNYTLAPHLEGWLAPETRQHLVKPEGDALDGALQLARAETAVLAVGA